MMAQLSLPPWVEFYGSSKNDVILTTANVALNGKLYSKLFLALEGTASRSDRPQNWRILECHQTILE